MPKKMLKYFCFVLNKYQTVIHVSTLIFLRAFQRTFYNPISYPKHYILTLSIYLFLIISLSIIHGGGAHPSPPPRKARNAGAD